MTRHRFATALLAVLIAMSALAGSAGVARADPDDAAPQIIDDLLVIVPGLTLDPRDRDSTQHGAGPKEWTGSGMYCQNQHVKCQKMGF
ncbi:hypothetical protein AO501_20905 [Mycobacterium gordonae]|uniref:Uncharacterized protein n=1 Tax=Mycobacterium gordonae TaxID=1778 RepID=A0A0Q2RWV0_MYCGO|nr:MULTISPECIES: hypothetical protein [Mycobacterium]KQH79643.1 hypothetical protein AO501_20905 [Mycobacterium gordonae]MDP7729391.1 hypothetical protein [Mycobacterium sp. TY813]